jgi:hypothetical protein
MSPDMEKIDLMGSANYHKLLTSGGKCVTDFIDLGTKTLVSYLDVESQVEFNPNVSVGIAAAISS